MASTSTTVSLSSPSTFIDRKAPRHSAAASPQCVTLPTLPPPPPVSSQTRPLKATTYCRKMARNVVPMATGETMTETMTTSETVTITESSAEIELPEMVKPIQEAWDKLDDKYAVASLAFAGAIALWGSVGLISAIDKLPLVPGVLELVGIGYSGWFAYRNLIFKPDRDALFEKIKCTYTDITGSS